MNAGKQGVALDLTDPTDRTTFEALLDVADIVVESARPRALRQLGFDAASARPRDASVLSITGYGREDNGYAFGDDAAIAAGLGFRARATRIPASAAMPGRPVRDSTQPPLLSPVSRTVGAVCSTSRCATWRRTPPRSRSRRRPSRSSLRPTASWFGTANTWRPSRLRAPVAPMDPRIDRWRRPPLRSSKPGRTTDVDPGRRGRRGTMRRAAGGGTDRGGRPRARTLRGRCPRGGGGALLPGLQDHHIHLQALAAAMNSGPLRLGNSGADEVGTSARRLRSRVDSRRGLLRVRRGRARSTSPRRAPRRCPDPRPAPQRGDVVPQLEGPRSARDRAPKSALTASSATNAVSLRPTLPGGCVVTRAITSRIAVFAGPSPRPGGGLRGEASPR